MEEWQEEVNKCFLKVEEGISNIEIHEPPEKVTNNFGKEQWQFDNAKVGGLKGILTPPKGLLRLISQALEDNGGEYPIKLTVKREGMDLKTRFTMQTEL